MTNESVRQQCPICGAFLIRSRPVDATFCCSNCGTEFST